MDRWMEIGRVTVGSGTFSERGAGAVDEMRAVDRAAGVHVEVTSVSIRRSRTRIGRQRRLDEAAVIISDNIFRK